MPPTKIRKRARANHVEVERARLMVSIKVVRTNHILAVAGLEVKMKESSMALAIIEAISVIGRGSCGR